MDFIKAIVRWLLRHFISFVVVVLILTLGHFFQRELTSLKEAVAQVTRLRSDEKALKQFVIKEIDSTKRRVRDISAATSNTLTQRIAEVDEEISRLQAGRPAGPVGPLDFATGTYLAKIEADVLLELRRQERAHLDYLRSAAITIGRAKQARDELERLRKTHAVEYDALISNETAQQQLKAEHPWTYWIPGTGANDKLKRLASAHTALRERTQKAADDYVRQKKIVDSIVLPKVLTEFEARKADLDRVVGQVSERIKDLQEEQAANWLNKLLQPVREANAIPLAVLIVFSAVLAPIPIKAVAYYLIAPAASRRRSIRLLPAGSGDIDVDTVKANSNPVGKRLSNASEDVSVGPDCELLIHPEYLRDVPDEGTKETKWLLDWAIPVSSLAAGLYALTRLRSSSRQSCVVSASKDPLCEVALLRVPAGSALVLQPHSLVGLLQSRTRPVRITRHWRLTSLTAWLTLQLRYLVFHGPATLIVKGCRGVGIGCAGSGRVVNQAATIGFSANLDYSVSRCETFASYLLGKKELFNDRFSGGPGYYVYEEMPHFGRRTGITGRGIEGILDSLRQVFGI